MKFYAPNDVLPVDGSHRWLAVQPDRKMSSDEIAKLGNYAGLYVGTVSTVELSEGTTYVVPVEAEFGGITPRFVSTKFQAPKLVITKDTVDPMVEQYSDFSETLEGQKPFPAAFLGPQDRVPQDGKWHLTIVTYLDPGEMLTRERIDQIFQNFGFDTAYTKGDEAVTQPGDRMLYVKASKETPHIDQIKAALEADMLNISVWPSRADIEFIESWEEGTGDLIAEVKGVAEGLKKAVSGAGAAVGDALDVIGFVGKIAVPLALGFGTYLAYQWLKPDEAK